MLFGQKRTKNWICSLKFKEKNGSLIIPEPPAMSAEDNLDILQDISGLLADDSHNESEDFNLSQPEHLPLVGAEDNIYTV